MNELNETKNELIEPEEDLELSHTDKLVGVFTEPAKTFTKISGFPLRSSDWLIPLLLVLLSTIISSIVIMSNPQIKYQLIQKQIEQIQKMADEGTIPQEAADTQKEMVRKTMESGVGAIFSSIGIVIFVTIFFFLISLFFWLISKFVLKGEGGYQSALIAYGLPHYIVIIQVIISVLISFSKEKVMQGTSLGSILDIQATGIMGAFYHLLDPFSIWFYVVAGIAFAKMNKSQNTGKYIGMMVGSWVIVTILMHVLADTLPFLKPFVNQG